jgi:phenylacetate-CoA ligase
MLNFEWEEKQQVQLERLQTTLNRAFQKVPFHQNRFLKAAIDPLEIESIKDMARLPFMERRHLGEYYPYGLFAVPLRDIVRIHTAPGTSYNPSVSGYTKQDLKIWRDIVSRALRAAKVSTDDILQITLEAGLANWGRDYKDGAEAIEASVIPNTPLSVEKQLMILRDYKTTVWITNPSSAAQLIHHMFTSEVNPTGLNLKTLILTGESVDDQFRCHLEDRLHAEVWLHYGLSEVPGPAIAFECEHHEGLHVNDQHFLAEIVHPETGELLENGQAGEIVLTTLTTRAFPLIRFRTGDRGRMIHEKCLCGRSLSRIEWLAERTDDIFSINGVKVHSQMVLRHLQESLGFVPEPVKFFIRPDYCQAATAERRHLEVWMALDDRIFSDEIKILERLMHRVEDKLEENLGVPVLLKLKEKRTMVSNSR